MSGKDEKKIQKFQAQFQADIAEFRAAGASEETAKRYLSKRPYPNWLHFTHSTLEELLVYQKVIIAKKSWHHNLPELQRCIAEKIYERNLQNSQASARSSIAKHLKKFEGLPARDIIIEAEELTALEVEALLAWEIENKNRASVVQALSQMLSGTAPLISSQPHSVSTHDVSFAPNPFEKENAKAYKRGRGTVRERCLSCGELNNLDVETVSAIVHRRLNTTKGRLDAWANRQIEGGARWSGQHAAAEAAKANRVAMGQLVSAGIPCVFCGAPMIR